MKPFSTIEFIARVKAQLRRYTYFNQNAVQVIEKKINIRGLEIDEVSRTVMLYGETINLTKTEYEILYLMAAARIVYLLLKKYMRAFGKKGLMKAIIQ